MEQYVAKIDRSAFFKSDFVMLMIRLALTVACVVVACFMEDPIIMVILLVVSAALIGETLWRLFKLLPNVRTPEPIVLRRNEVVILDGRKMRTVARDEVQNVACRVTNGQGGGVFTVYFADKEKKAIAVSYVADLYALKTAAEQLGYPVVYLA